MNEKSLTFSLAKVYRFRCPQGHEWADRESDGITFRQGTWAQTVHVCFRCMADYVAGHFEGENIGKETPKG